MSTEPRVYAIVHDEDADTKHGSDFVSDFDACVYTIPQNLSSDSNKKQFLTVHIEDYQALEQKLAVAENALCVALAYCSLEATWRPRLEEALALIKPERGDV